MQEWIDVKVKHHPAKELPKEDRERSRLNGVDAEERVVKAKFGQG